MPPLINGFKKAVSPKQAKTVSFIVDTRSGDKLKMIFNVSVLEAPQPSVTVTIKEVSFDIETINEELVCPLLHWYDIGACPVKTTTLILKLFAGQLKDVSSATMFNDGVVTVTKILSTKGLLKKQESVTVTKYFVVVDGFTFMLCVLSPVLHSYR